MLDTSLVYIRHKKSNRGRRRTFLKCIGHNAHFLQSVSWTLSSMFRGRTTCKSQQLMLIDKYRPSMGSKFLQLNIIQLGNLSTRKRALENSSQRHSSSSSSHQLLNTIPYSTSNSYTPRSGKYEDIFLLGRERNWLHLLCLLDTFRHCTQLLNYKT